MQKYLDEYRAVDASLGIASGIRKISTKPFNIMEVCGGHTMAIRKNGIHKLVGKNIRLISGPGCPVCVTSIGDIDKAVALSGMKNVAVCTFGDMVYVPGTEMSLSGARAAGGDVRVVYSAHDALEFAKSEPQKQFVFISIGFETTTPTSAAAVLEAERENIANFSILALNKTMPAALEAVLSDKSSKIDALICPGHVSTITGTGMYKFIPEKLGVSCCVSGFEPVDILRAIYLLAELHERGEVKLINAYERVVMEAGNEKAQHIMAQVFEERDVEWRGFGIIPGSGLGVRARYGKFDAEKRFDIKVKAGEEVIGCRCGDILRGIARPADCALFRKACDPMSPKGACMVSSEGTCAAWYKYGAE